MASYTTAADLDLPLIEARYGLTALELVPMDGGMANSSFLATSPDGRFVLTVLDNHGADGAARLAALTEELLRRGAPTSELVPTLDGGRVTETHGRPVILKRWLSGRTLPALPPESLRAAGRLLGELHGIPTAGLALPVATRRLSADHLRAVGTFPDRRFAHWLTARLDRLGGTAAEGPADDARCGFVHGDFHADNIVVRPDGTLAVLDWETATVDDQLLDVGMALVGHAREGEGLSPARAETFVAGYRQVVDLTESDLRRLPSAVEYAALIIAFHRYNRHHVRFPDPAKAHLFQQMTRVAETADALSFTRRR
ncbi:phosphotransferase [Streptomyces sp. NPDC008150]|uniref:phosphotransferase n=1 Tax=Streptomyces sp. NPDC008150 TaxID=3364816 RepID=UPI0036DFFE95